MFLTTPNISREQWNTFLYDPEVVTLEILVIILTLLNVFILYRILLDICPFPAFVTWVQLLMRLVCAWLFGGVSTEWPDKAYFSPVVINCRLYRDLACPTIVYLGMATSANFLLQNIPAVATFPVAVAPAICLHAVSRFIGCGQMYTRERWISLGIMLIGAIIGIMDKRSIGLILFPFVICYATCSAVFRAWFLERALHVVNGCSNSLHVHTTVFGLFLLLPVSLMLGEVQVFNWMPTDGTRLFTWQSWGCLVVAGAIPFVKNIAANRLIRRTGQAPWRILEVITMVVVVLIGAAIWDSLSLVGFLAFALVFSGRVIGTLDVLSKSPMAKQRALLQSDPQVEKERPSRTRSSTEVSTGVYEESFDHEDELEPAELAKVINTGRSRVG